MKFIYCLLILLLVCSEHSSAQSYHSMLGDSNRWNVDYQFRYYWHTADVDFDEIHYTVVCHTSGDTSISGLLYKKIYIKDKYNEYSLGHSGMVGFIREDTIARKVFYRDKDSLSETVIYDFNLTSGDSIYLQFEKALDANYYTLMPPVSGWYGLDSSSTVQTVKGARKQLSLSSSNYYTRKTLDWVEGVGSMKSPLYFYNPPLMPFIGVVTKDGTIQPYYTITLACAYRDGEPIYLSGEDCFSNDISGWWIGISSIKQYAGGCKVVCNKYGCRLYDDAPYPTRYAIEVFNAAGQKVADLRASCGQTIIPFQHSLPAGIYFIRLISTNNIISFKQFIN